MSGAREDICHVGFGIGARRIAGMVEYLFETMMAYSGSCRIEDEVRLVIKVDAASHPAWVGSEQLRFFNVDGGTLSITTAWQTHPKFPGRMARGVLTAQRL
jgi:hypothetical protein